MSDSYEDIGDVGGFEKPSARISDKTLTQMKTDLGEAFNDFGIELQADWLAGYPEVREYLIDKTGSDDITNYETMDELDRVFKKLVLMYLNGSRE